jgi:hypothetical protein
MSSALANDVVNPGNFLAELKRRNVYKVAVAYAVIIRNLNKITTVMKGGHIYDPRAVEQALGIKPPIDK